MAQFVEIDIDQGTDYSLDLGLKNDDGSSKNVVGYTFSSAIKKSYYSTNNVASFIVNTNQASTGNIILSMNAATTANIRAGRYLFDIKQTDANNLTQRLTEGIVTVNPRITS